MDELAEGVGGQRNPSRALLESGRAMDGLAEGVEGQKGPSFAERGEVGGAVGHGDRPSTPEDG